MSRSRDGEMSTRSSRKLSHGGGSCWVTPTVLLVAVQPNVPCSSVAPGERIANRSIKVWAIGTGAEWSCERTLTEHAVCARASGCVSAIYM